MSCREPTGRVTFDGGKRSVDARARRVRVERSGDVSSFVESVDRPDHVARRTQARGQFPRRRLQRPDDVAREGADDLVSDGAARRKSRCGRDDAAFPFTTTSWYFLDALDVMAPDDTVVMACFGDSITDGTGSTLNGDDRWPDVLSRRLHVAMASRVAVVNAGIGGNRVAGPGAYSLDAPVGGGPSALERLDRDVLGLSGLSAIIWLEGINDLAQGATADAVIAGMREVVRRCGRWRHQDCWRDMISSLGSTTRTGRRRSTPAAGDQRLHPDEGSSTASSISMPRRATPQTGGLRARSSPTARSAAPATVCIPIAPATRRWDRRWTLRCWARPLPRGSLLSLLLTSQR